MNLREGVPRHDVAVERRIVEPLGELRDETRVDFFSDRTDLETSKRHRWRRP